MGKKNARAIEFLTRREIEALLYARNEGIDSARLAKDTGLVSDIESAFQKLVERLFDQ